jgi:hypothetical protein
MRGVVVLLCMWPLPLFDLSDICHGCQPLSCNECAATLLASSQVAWLKWKLCLRRLLMGVLTALPGGAGGAAVKVAEREADAAASKALAAEAARCDRY